MVYFDSGTAETAICIYGVYARTHIPMKWEVLSQPSQIGILGGET